MCFYYEGVSAEVVGSILCINRNEPFYIEWLSEKLDVSVQSLIPFLDELKNYGLLTNKIASKEGVFLYRQHLKSTHKQQVENSIDVLH